MRDSARDIAPNILVIGDFSNDTLGALSDSFTLHHIERRGDFDSFTRERSAEIAGIAALATIGWAPKSVIDALPDLEMISSFGVGYDGIDAAYAAQKGVMVGHTPHVLDDEVANTILALIFAVERRIAACDRYIRAGSWEKKGNPPLTRGLAGKNIGILGLGRIGLAFAEKLSVFNCEIAYHGRTEQNVPYAYHKTLLSLARASDILVVTVPGGAPTENLVDAEILRALGPQGTLVNVSRGSVIDEKALVSALERGELGAAGLDVFADEPRVPKALLKMEQTVLTPHIGSATLETRQAMSDCMVENLVRFFRRGRPLYAVPECQSLLA